MLILSDLIKLILNWDYLNKIKWIQIVNNKLSHGYLTSDKYTSH